MFGGPGKTPVLFKTCLECTNTGSVCSSCVSRAAPEIDEAGTGREKSEFEMAEGVDVSPREKREGMMNTMFNKWKPRTWREVVVYTVSLAIQAMVLGWVIYIGKQAREESEAVIANVAAVAETVSDMEFPGAMYKRV